MAASDDVDWQEGSPGAPEEGKPPLAAAVSAGDAPAMSPEGVAPPSAAPVTPVAAGSAAAGGEEEQEDEVLDADFFMYKAKVKMCPRKDAHPYTSCPYAHPHEPAARRDPRVIPYDSVFCYDLHNNKACHRGVSCPYAHSVFEYFLHPSRFRTRMCDSGASCTRPLCFFAHKPEELRERPLPPMNAAAPLPRHLQQQPGGGGSSHSPRVQLLSAPALPTSSACGTPPGMAAPMAAFSYGSSTSGSSNSLMATAHQAAHQPRRYGLPPGVTMQQVAAHTQQQQLSPQQPQQHPGTVPNGMLPNGFDVVSLGVGGGGGGLQLGGCTFVPHSSSMVGSAGAFAPAFASSSGSPTVMAGGTVMACPPLMQQQQLVVTTTQQQVAMGAQPQLLTLAGGGMQPMQGSAGGFVDASSNWVAGGHLLPQQQPQQQHMLSGQVPGSYGLITSMDGTNSGGGGGAGMPQFVFMPMPGDATSLSGSTAVMQQQQQFSGQLMMPAAAAGGACGVQGMFVGGAGMMPPMSMCVGDQQQQQPVVMFVNNAMQ